MSFFISNRATIGFGLLVASVAVPAAAQTTSAISGTLLDKTTQQPLPFATVVLLRAQDSTLVTGTQTSETGTFRLEAVPPGNYHLRASVLGYKSLRSTVSVNAGQALLQLGTVALAPSTQQLQGVTVTGEKAAVVDNLDKRVINVSKDLTSIGGTAVNVLQNVPSVSVDQSGQVSLRGTSNVTVYIDGKPTGAAGGGRNVNLDQIPASQIETVEVITNPSARYDAEGSGGIINIVLKKQKQDGFNGQAVLNVGTGDKYAGSLGLNRRRGKANFFGNYDFRQDRRWGRNDVYQSSTTGTSTLDTYQLSRNAVQNITHTVRAGLDFSPTPEHTITLAVQPAYTEVAQPEDLSTRLETGGNSTNLNSRNAVDSYVRSGDVSLDYRRTWKDRKRRELTANAVSTAVNGKQTLAQRQNEGLANQAIQEQRIGFELRQSSAQVDYTHPVGEKGRLDVGAKAALRATDGTYDFMTLPEGSTDFVRDEARSNSYRFGEHVQAGYVTYQNESGKLSYQAGLRAENTAMRGLLRNTGQRFDSDYLNLFPSATVAYTLPAEQRLQLSYSRRINRPDVPLLLPFANYSDPRNYRVGNTGLRPEYINALELGHQKSWGGATLSTVAFYRQTIGQIQRFRSIDEEASRYDPVRNPNAYIITKTTFVNIGHNDAYGLEMSLNQPLTKWWRVNLNGSAFRNTVASVIGSEQARANTAYTARLNSTVSPAKLFDLQLTANYRSATVTSQGTLQPIYFFDLGLKRDVLKNRGSVTLRISDLFDTNQINVKAYGEGLFLDLQAKRESRIAFLGFTYRFGTDQQPARPRRRGDDGPAPAAPNVGY